MKKFIKTLSVMLIAAVCTVCVALFAACGGGDGEELATDTIYITVLDENGNAIDGTTFGEHDFNPDNHQVQIQFCTLGGNCSAENANVGTDGKAEFPVSIVKELAEEYNTDTVELHVISVTKKGYLKGDETDEVIYGQFNVNKIPKNITVTLKKA